MNTRITFRLLNLLPIITMVMFSLNARNQNVDHHPEDYDDYTVCSHKGCKAAMAGQKSVINPNPFVFHYDVKFYKLNLEAYDTTNQFTGYAEITAQVIVAAMDTFSIELSNKLSADSVFINGVMKPFSHVSNNITVPLDPPLPMDQLFTFRLYYHTPPDYTSIYYSATTDPTWGNYPVSQTFSEPYFAHEWMPCKQELDDKADSVHIFITTSDNLRVAGPGLLTKVNLPDGKIRHEWRTNQLTAFYLIAFAISEYQEYALYAKPDSLINDSILILNYVYDYPNCLESNLANINQTKPMLELLSNFYGLYPFYKEKYGHYMWYPANFSGMEHITMSGMRNFGFDLISHEIGHSWFGNNVTCATWQDIWINEGFATYTEYLVRENLISKASADARMAAFHNTVLSQPAGSVYVPASSLTSWGRIFSTRLTYRKGGALVHMIRFEMQNDSLFYRTLYEFQQQYKDSIATGIEFRDMCHQVTGIDFTDFFDQWYIGEGHPIYSLDWWQDEDTLFMHVTQATSAPVTPLFKMLMEYRVEFASGDTIIRNYQLSNDSVYKYTVVDEVTGIVIDPNNWVLNLVGNIRHLKQAKLRVFLEGAYDETAGKMSTALTPDFIPLNQPHNQPPWNYNGTEQVSSLPGLHLVDWILVALHDTDQAQNATPATIFKRFAGFLTEDGRIVSHEGDESLRFDQDVSQNLFVSIYHRNHLSVVTAIPVVYEKGNYIFNFSTGSGQVLGGAAGHKELTSGTWGMFAGDANADGIVDLSDKSSYWEPNAGTQGYLSSDLNLDSQVNNQDKDDMWVPNLGKTSQVPQ